MTTLTLPSVLAFDRKLEPSDALMYSGLWKNKDDNKAWSEIELFDRRNRAVHSNFSQEVLDDEEALQEMMAKPNLSWGDDTSLSHEHDTLRVSFSLRVVSGLGQPSACNKQDFGKAYSELIENCAETCLQELANRYAYNIANGRFLWRNRVGSQAINIVVKHSSLKQPLEFNAYDFSLKQTTTDDKKVIILAQLIKAGLSGEENILLNISAFTKLGEGQRIWPSQEMVLAKGEKSRHLFSLNGVAAMHCEKIGNALRTIDDWYPEFENTQTPIAVEAYGSVTQRGVAYRSTKNDFKTLLLKWLNSDEKTAVSESEKHFVVAMLIRGGVFGESES